MKSSMMRIVMNSTVTALLIMGLQPFIPFSVQAASQGNQDGTDGKSYQSMQSNRTSDKQIKRAIQENLKSNPLVDQQDIDVTVKNGRVALNGTAQTEVEKNHAYLSAWIPAGVKGVQNNIEVRSRALLSDKELKQAIARAYALDPRVVQSRPKVQVKDGVVTLTGTVADQQAKQAAEEIAFLFKDVSRVKNRLNIDGSLAKGEPEDLDAFVLLDIDPVTVFTQADLDLKEAVEGQLTWSPFVDADKVGVSVHDGIVYLSGTMEDQDEIDAAIDNAFDAGADRVVSRLEVG